MRRQPLEPDTAPPAAYRPPWLMRGLALACVLAVAVSAARVALELRGPGPSPSQPSAAEAPTLVREVAVPAAPVVAATPAPRRSSRAAQAAGGLQEELATEIEQHLERLRASGPCAEPWTAAAPGVFAVGAAAKFGPVECYSGGCAVTAVYADAAQFDAVNRAIEGSGAFAAWAGGKYHSGALAEPGGGVRALWVLFRPAEALQARR